MEATFHIGEPAGVMVRTDEGWRQLTAGAAGSWTAQGISVGLQAAGGAYALELEAPGDAVRLIKLRWRTKPQGRSLILGDHWERGYGELEWRGIVPERVLPWYFLSHDGSRTAGYGVKTGPNAFCYWQLDADGITFTADVASGSEGVRLGARKLLAAELLHDPGIEGDSPFAAAQRFCRLMCEQPSCRTARLRRQQLVLRVRQQLA